MGDFDAEKGGTAMHLSSCGVWVSLLSVTEWRSEGKIQVSGDQSCPGT